MAEFADLAASREACRAMTRRHAKTFYFASHVLPQTKRRDAYAVYAFCRYVDDRIDLAPHPETRVSALAELHELLATAYEDTAHAPHSSLEWMPAFRETVRRRVIPATYFGDLLKGVEMDVGRVRLRSWADLDNYCYHVASVVGLIMVHVIAEPRPALLLPARDLGTAMQLTNILRDIGEDWRNDRVYLPAEELALHGWEDANLARQKVDESFRGLMRSQVARARAYYRSAEPGIVALPDDGSRYCVRLMSTVYGAILDEIERADYDVFSRRARVSLPRKIWIAGRNYFC